MIASSLRSLGSGIEMRSIRFSGDFGNNIEYGAIPPGMADEAARLREEMLDNLSMVNDELTEAIPEGSVTPEAIRKALRDSTIALKCTPVMMGSALGNKGVQLLLDGVAYYLPDPRQVENVALDLDKDEAPVVLSSDSSKPLVMLAFKLEDGRYGQLTYMRIYQGTVSKGDFIVNNSANGKRIKVPRLVRMHSNEMNDIDSASAGDIVALFGVECASGDTFTNESIAYTMTSMHVPDAVISLAVAPKDKGNAANFSKALNRFTKEDPTFRVYRDEQSAETIIQGMGELHLEIYIERMKREYNCEVVAGKPQVAYRETIRGTVESEGKHVKQSGGRGQFGHVWLKIEPNAQGKGNEFINGIVGGSVPREFIPAVEKGVKEAIETGVMAGYPVVDTKVTLFDGSYHDVDSDEISFRMAAIFGFKDGFRKAKPVILEPIMKVEVVTPEDYMGDVIGDLNRRRGQIQGMEDTPAGKTVTAEVPLSEMFGYATNVRSMSQGRATFTMEFAKYMEVPPNIADGIINK